MRLSHEFRQVYRVAQNEKHPCPMYVARQAVTARLAKRFGYVAFVRHRIWAVDSMRALEDILLRENSELMLHYLGKKEVMPQAQTVIEDEEW